MRHKQKSFKIYLVNLTHTDVALASGSFPLGIAYIASSLKKFFKDDVDVKLFKYPEELELAIREDMPDAYLFSNYLWSQNLPLAFAKRIKEQFPDCLIIGGGPNISKDRESQVRYLRKHPYIDFYILHEGEGALCNLIERYLVFGRSIKKLKEAEHFSAIALMPDGSMKEGPLAPRLGIKRDLQIREESSQCEAVTFFKDINDVPSPYLMGLMDRFFDDRLYPLIETNRGCPFSCSYCQQGDSYFTKIAMRSLDIIKEELDYIAYYMSKKSPGVFRLEIADANFAMFPQDIEICRHISMLQKKYSWPRYIYCSTAKNKPEKVLEAVSMLDPDSLLISNSVQSMNTATLKAIKRDNVNFGGYSKLQEKIRKRGLRSQADLILGLPLENKSSHFEAVYELIDAGIQEFTSFQAMLLKSSELELDNIQKRYSFTTKWRLLPRAIGSYAIGGKPEIVSEVEEIIVATDTLSYEDYLDSRRLHLITMIYHNSNIFELAQLYLKKYNIKPSRLIQEIYNSSTRSDFALKRVFDDFISETKMELFDSERDCLEFYSRPETLKEVKMAKVGNNLLYAYLAIAFFEYWNETVCVMLAALQNISPIDHERLEDFSKIFKARIVNLSEALIKRSDSFRLKSCEIASLLMRSECQIEKDSMPSFLVNMELNDEKFEILSHARHVYPNNRIGWSLILANHHIHVVVREPNIRKVVEVC